MLTINQTRFLRTIHEMAQIGLLSPQEGGGRDRRPFSPADRAARDYLRREAQAAGLTVRMDQAANLSARLDCGDPGAQTVLLGSHLDTVPNGGAYDGALGVLAGLETLRTLQESGLPLRHHVEVMNFTDEEGRFGNLVGSRALSGEMDDDLAESFLANAAAYPEDLAAMRAIVPGGLTVESMKQARRDPASLAAYLEIHIEQGPRLEHAGAAIGIVSGIFGRRSHRLLFHGRSDHAGTTPLDLRQDALVAAAQFIAQAPQAVAGHFPGTVVTCGNVAVKPGVFNVVPSLVEVWLEFRAGTSGELAGMEALLRRVAEEAGAGSGSRLEFLFHSHSEPTPMDGDLRAVIAQAAQERGYASLVVPSGAGHDAQSLAPIVPTAMIFVPSRGGRSHSPDEFTQEGDLVAGANVLLQSVLTLAGE
jgi:N-carbamoyl-L-amino-acid hydrolase